MSMKKPILILLASFLFLTSCEVGMQDVIQDCDAVAVEDVKSWVQEFRKKNNQSEPAFPQLSTEDIRWIGKANLKGKTIFYAMRFADGMQFCGTGLTFDDMYVAFDCKGKRVTGLDWEELEDYEEFYSSYVVEEHEPS